MPRVAKSKTSKSSKKTKQRSPPSRAHSRKRSIARRNIISSSVPKSRRLNRVLFPKKVKGPWPNPDYAFDYKGVASPEHLQKTPDSRGKRMKRDPKFKRKLYIAAYDEKDSGARHLIEETKRRRVLGRVRSDSKSAQTPSRSKLSALYESYESGLDSPVESPNTPSTLKIFLEKLKCGTLRSICKDLQIRCAGRKAELIRRIMSN